MHSNELAAKQAKQIATSGKQAKQIQSECTQRLLSIGMHSAAPFNRNALSCKAGEAGCHERQAGRSRLLSIGMHSNELAEKQA